MKSDDNDINGLRNIVLNGWELLDKHDYPAAFNILKPGIDSILPLNNESVQASIRDLADKQVIAELLTGMAICYESMGQPKESIDLLELGLEIFPNCEKAWLAKYEFHRNRKEFDKGLSCAERLIEINPRNCDGWNCKGNMLGYLGQVSQALFCFQRSLEIVRMPFNLEAWAAVEQCKALIKSAGSHEEAVKTFYYNGLGSSDIGRHQEGKTWFTCATLISPTDKNAWLGSGNASLELEDYEEAITCFDQALAIDPNFSNALINISACYLHWKKFDQAIDSYNKALKSAPQSAIVWSGLGHCYLEKQNYLEAANSYQKALDLDPAWFEGWKNLGLALILQGRYEEARKPLIKALQIKPSSPETSIMLQSLDLILSTKQNLPLEREHTVELLANRYEVRSIHQGGMGIVYCAWDRKLLQMVALKTYKNKFLEDILLSNMFVEEATNWTRLGHHQNIVTAFMVDRIDGKPYVVLEYIEGETLRNWIEQRKLNIYHALDFCIQFCTGMIFISEQIINENQIGLLHRDIKPENILITDDGVVKITDFGLAKPLSDLLSKGVLNSLLTDRISSVRGTTAYMSPEQLLGNLQLDTRSDVYSFGVVMYEMLTNKKPFEWNTVGEYKENIMHLEPASPEVINPNISEQLCQIVLKCLKRDREDRYHNFNDFRKDLLACYKAQTLNDFPAEKLSVLDKTGKPNPDVLKLRASTETLLNNPQQALELLKKVEKENDSQLWRNKGIVLIELGHYEEAVQCFGNAIDYSSTVDDKALAMTSKADALMHLNQLDQAINCLDQVIEMSTEYHNQDLILSAAFCNKGNALREKESYLEALGCYQEAEKHFRSLASKSSLIPDQQEILAVGGNSEDIFWYNWGLTYRLVGQPDIALVCQQKALSLNPNLPPALAEVGFQYVHIGNYERALQKFQVACEKNKTNRFLLRKDDIIELYNKTYPLESNGKYQQALYIYDILILLRPKVHPYWTARGICLAALNRYKEALASHDKAISLYPGDYQPWLNKASLLYDLNEYEEALDCVDEVIRLNPTHKNAPQLREYCLRAIESNESLQRKTDTLNDQLSLIARLQKRLHRRK
jgi:tetratricopeptide (TPR) repeat protein